MNYEYISTCILIICLTIATYTDLKKRIVPNKLILASLTIGLLINLHHFGFVNGLKISLLRLLLAFTLVFLPGLSPGDVKLFQIVSLLSPLKMTVLIIYISFVITLIVWIIRKIKDKNLKEIVHLPFAPMIFGAYLSCLIFTSI